MGENFYRVTFENVDENYYFHNHEDATAFLLESYFDDYEVSDEEDVIAINNEVADTDMIDDYGWIVQCWFEA